MSKAKRLLNEHQQTVTFALCEIDYFYEEIRLFLSLYLIITLTIIVSFSFVPITTLGWLAIINMIINKVLIFFVAKILLYLTVPKPTKEFSHKALVLLSVIEHGLADVLQIISA